VHNVLAFSRARLARAGTTAKRTAKQLREKILGRHAAVHSAVAIQAFFAKLIVNLAFLRVRQHFVRVRDVFELVAGIRVLVGMVFQR
jgi:hypothetical protein